MKNLFNSRGLKRATQPGNQHDRRAENIAWSTGSAVPVNDGGDTANSRLARLLRAPGTSPGLASGPPDRMLAMNALAALLTGDPGRYRVWSQTPQRRAAVTATRGRTNRVATTRAPTPPPVSATPMGLLAAPPKRQAPTQWPTGLLAPTPTPAPRRASPNLLDWVTRRATGSL